MIVGPRARRLALKRSPLLRGRGPTDRRDSRRITREHDERGRHEHALARLVVADRADKRALARFRGEDGLKIEIAVRDVDEQQAVRRQVSATVSDPAWNSDSSRIAFTSSGGGSMIRSNP